MKQSNQKLSPLLIQFRALCERRANVNHHKIEDLNLSSPIILQFFLCRFFDKRSNSFRPIEGYEVEAYPHQNYLAVNLRQFLSEITVIPSTENSNSLYNGIHSIHGDKFFRAMIQYEPSELPYIDSVSVLMRYMTWEVDIHGVDLRQLENWEFSQFARKFGVESLTNLWKRLTIDECIEYTSQNIAKLVSQKLHVSHSLFILFEKVLQSFTLGQAFRIIYLCAGFSLRKIQENHISVLLYQKVLLENIEYYTNKVIKEYKNIEPFARPRCMPQSGLCKILFHHTLHAEIDPIDLLITRETMMKVISDFAEPEED